MSTASVTDLLERPDQFFIGGDWVAPSSDARIDVINPATEELFLRVAEAQADDMNRAVAAARHAFDKGPWPRMTHAERATYLRAFAAELRRRLADISSIWTSEVGVTRPVADAFMGGVPEIFDYYAGLAETFQWVERHEALHSPGAVASFLVREPVGVVGAIVPWNGAANLAAWKCAPALIAGCTVVLKASPESPGGPLVFGEIAKAIGLPAGVLNVVTADREVSELLVRNPAIDKITFTGSSVAGKKIASICGERIARCTLELGGKSAAVILDDYDVEEAASHIAAYAPMLSGQVCSSLTRLVISKHRHDAFAEAMAEAFKAIRVGDPADASVGMGPLAMARQRDRVEGYIAKGREEGATVATGGGRPAHLNRGYFVEPTVFANVDNRMTIAREEIFGPVVSIIPADSEEHAVEIANDTLFGLNSSVFTNDATRAYQVARQLQAGTVGHNWFRTDFSIAFGGFKQSGIGREGGTEGLMPFLEAKTIILEGEPRLG
ncbi:aldehyde dehydrogenase [Sphingomonas sp. CL5.1]|uniref:aldehyde dehydrogenase n=1 Tax=Sphingomonas sp. CL5.1 TaxID=2653203 RepID=UPI001581E7AF|nr:aldehyde dehydrogenase [Sphingomonas sp. CL5.1]QKS01096.1 aldehyde dehydrogenase [Sphingomonas sp. CL5.1]